MRALSHDGRKPLFFLRDLCVWRIQNSALFETTIRYRHLQRENLGFFTCGVVDLNGTVKTKDFIVLESQEKGHRVIFHRLELIFLRRSPKSLIVMEIFSLIRLSFRSELRSRGPNDFRFFFVSVFA